jgi:shikimate kinase
MQKIFLIGYMGSGKTTVGKLLAKSLELQFIDLDLFIENRYRKSINAIFTEKEEAGFREIEQKCLHEVSQFENIVIATGGGAPCFFDNMTFMNQTGTTIYLKSSIEELTKRLNAGKEKRPLIKDKNKEELTAFISSNLEKREPFYNQATYIYDTERLATEKEVESVVNYLISNFIPK